MVNHAHLVGSLATATPEESFRLVAELLGDSAARIPDGEVGERWHWILFQHNRLAATPGLSRIALPEPIRLGELDITPLNLDGSVAADDIRIGNLGYADAALASYEIFREFQARGEIGPAVRFQVSLPTPVAVLSAFVVPTARAALEPAYKAALVRELERIVAGIPAESLAIQFDLAVEFIYIEQVDLPGYASGGEPWFGDAVTDAADRVAELLAHVPEPVAAGLHLCYGDIAEAHFKEPSDAANLALFANAIAARLSRSLQWLHLPVPIERDDAAYFAPLADLHLPAETDLFLGLIHREDGEAGLRRRAAAAREFVQEFGTATECGIGRIPAADRDRVLQLHTIEV